MTSVSPTELLKRAEEAIQRSRKLCAETRRLFEEVRERIARVGEADRKLEAALYSTREAKAAALVARFRALENRLPTAANVNALPEDLRRWEIWRRSLPEDSVPLPGRKELSWGVQPRYAGLSGHKSRSASAPQREPTG